MATYLSTHTHRFGTDTKVFQCPDDKQPDEIFAGLTEDDKIDFAADIGIDFEPDRDETLEIQFINLDTIETFDLSNWSLAS